MGALAVNQLLENSQEKGVELTLETSALENQVSVCQVMLLQKINGSALHHHCFTEPVGSCG